VSVTQQYLKFSFRLNLVLGIINLIFAFNGVYRGQSEFWNGLAFIIGALCIAQAVIQKGKLQALNDQEVANNSPEDDDTL
jgi:hypothetical protein